MTSVRFSRRQFVAAMGGAFTAPLLLRGQGGKPMRGVFPIMATPFTGSKAVDYDDLAKEVEFLDRCGVHGMVWPQLASEYFTLTKQERFQGMEVLAQAARGKKPALIFGVQGPNIKAALEYVEQAEKLGPDGVIAIPPSEAKTLDDFRNYYRAIASATKRPIFVQTSGGAKNIEPTIECLVGLAKEFPNCAYVKEEYDPIVGRMKQLAANRPLIKGIFSGAHGKAWTYEMRLGMDGTCPGSPLSDVYVKIWDLYQGGNRTEALDVFSKLMLVVYTDQQIPGTFQYLMKRRGVFKTMVSRQRDIKLAPEEIEEIEANFAVLKPYLRV